MTGVSPEVTVFVSQAEAALAVLETVVVIGVLFAVIWRPGLDRVEPKGPNGIFVLAPPAAE
jgi:hypothetical protein